MANIFADPINSVLGATVAGASGALGGATWAASEFGKFGRKIGGTWGEISGVMLGTGTGAIGGLLLGSVIGALAREGAVSFYLGDFLSGRPRGDSLGSNQERYRNLEGEVIDAER